MNDAEFEEYYKQLKAKLTREVKYRAFLSSPEWRSIRLRKLERVDYACERCGADDQTLDVHHKTYDRFGGREESSDLEVLCRRCHERHHGRIFEGYAE